MSKIDLSIYGISGNHEIIYNPSYEDLFKYETDPNNEGWERGVLTDLDAVAVDTGIFTGRSPKDKYIVEEETSRDNIWWRNEQRKSSDNKPVSEEVWRDLWENSAKALSETKRIFVMDAYAGANEDTRLKIRVITQVAWAAHFVKNMFIRPSEEELKDFQPDFVMLHTPKTVNPKWKEHGLHSEVYAVFNLKEKRAAVGGTWYGGEIKKGFFSIMNYYLPLKGIASMHCSANMGEDGDTAIFFGLSGTGKTTLSADPKRRLIGDDEHGWDDRGVFNFEGGCYAKVINLDPEKEPIIYKAIRRNALLENVVVDAVRGNKVWFECNVKTENTRVSYPLYHVENAVIPSRGNHPKNVIFLTADAFGVLPPVAKLTMDQTKYYFLNGYTAKVAGTERGIKEPVPTFSAGFGAAFLLLHPTVYAEVLVKKMEEHGSQAWLVNTGWTGGPYGVGKRMDLPITRKIIDAILDGTLAEAEYELFPVFNLWIPKAIPGIDSAILNPRNTWADKDAYDRTRLELAKKFIENFKQFMDNEEGIRLAQVGPQID